MVTNHGMEVTRSYRIQSTYSPHIAHQPTYSPHTVHRSRCQFPKTHTQTVALRASKTTVIGKPNYARMSNLTQTWVVLNL